MISLPFMGEGTTAKRSGVGKQGPDASAGPEPQFPTLLACGELSLPVKGGRQPYRGSLVAPIRYSSTARAHWRPSRIAQTTRDWPRRMSPQEKMFGAEVR